jgi:putative spermidine/putrescine transport system ATP-binding protein
MHLQPASTCLPARRQVMSRTGLALAHSTPASGGESDAAADAALRLRAISKTYDGDSLAVRHLDLDVVRGEFLTLLGPSGSGKTSTLMMVAGFEAPTTGEIFLEGRRLANLPPHKRDIGVVFQNYALFPHMSVGENIAFPLSVRKVPAAEIARRVARALEMVRLQGYAERRPTQLSGGQQQRVALARALVFEPKLLLMDEPLGALDRQLREQMQLEIRSLHERLGITAIYVTHDQAEALTMSDRIAVFNAGSVQQLDSPKTLYESPRNAFVARFIGENNRLSGILESRDAERCRVRIGEGVGVLACPRDVGPVGARATLSLRPERIKLAKSTSVPAGAGNCFRATVRETIYLGDHARIRLAVFGSGEIMAKVPTATVDVEAAPGDELVVQWRPEDCLAFAPEADDAAEAACDPA